MYRALFLVTCLISAACSPWEQAEPGPRSGRPRSLLTAQERDTTRLTRRWLVGYWTVEAECLQDVGTSLWADGTFTMGGGYGRWSLSGNILTTELMHPPTGYPFLGRLGDSPQYRIWIAGPDTIRAQPVALPGHDALNLVPMYRCEG